MSLSRRRKVHSFPWKMEMGLKPVLGVFAQFQCSNNIISERVVMVRNRRTTERINDLLAGLRTQRSVKASCLIANEIASAPSCELVKKR